LSPVLLIGGNLLLAGLARVETIDLMPVVPPTFDLWYDELRPSAGGCELIGRALAQAILAGA
jgi:hypothetical protein